MAKRSKTEHAREFAALVSHLKNHTVFGLTNGAPSASCVPTALDDLKYLQTQRTKSLIKVHHNENNCGGVVLFVPHPTDPILSTFRCEGCFDTGYYRAWCNTVWQLRDVLKFKPTDFQRVFVTELVEDDREWPEKIAWATEGSRCFTTLRKLTREELLESRAKRVMEIRENVP